MGFGTKVDFATGRKLNLDATYQNLIKPAVEDAGLECWRADEIVHSGNINVPMYRNILTADLVVADVSTANCNAFYELGVRHALRPSTTIIIAEDGYTFPFDINQIAILKYKHLGDDIGVSEARRFTAQLRDSVTTILAKDPPDDDSPVYTFLHGLRRLRLPEDLNEGTRAVVAAVAAAQPAVTPDETHSALMQKVDEAQKREEFEKAKALLTVVWESQPNEPYITQRLALLTYKVKQDTPAKKSPRSKKPAVFSKHCNQKQQTIPRHWGCGGPYTSAFGTNLGMRVPSMRPYAATSVASIFVMITTMGSTLRSYSTSGPRTPSIWRNRRPILRRWSRSGRRPSPISSRPDACAKRCSPSAGSGLMTIANRPWKRRMQRSSNT
jgi:hypothetical protein